MSAGKRITFPHMGDYWIPMRHIADLSDAEVVVPPAITRRTIELGARYSPEFVCVPFKYTLGCFLESLEAGANVLCQLTGGCRYSYYAEVQKAILTDLGHEFEFIDFRGGNLWQIARDFQRKAAPGQPLHRIASRFLHAWRMGLAMDEVQGFVRRNLAFEADRGSLKRIEKTFLTELEDAVTVRRLDALRRETMTALDATRLDRPADAPRVAVVGELYVVMEPYSNSRIEDELSANGVEVQRWLDLTTLLRHSFTYRSHIRKTIDAASPYVTRHIGAEGTESVARTVAAMRDGYDGVVHIKPFGCMPEVNAMAALQRISRDNTFPILFVSCDSQSAEAGLRTRVEAFSDMLKTRRAGLLHG